MGAPVGPTGCNAGSGGGEWRTRGFQLSALHSRSWSHLHFEDGSEPVLAQQTVVGSFGYYFRNGWSIAVSGGGVFGGTVRGDGHDLAFGPGWLVSARVAWRWLEEKGPIPYIMTSLTFSFSRSGIEGSGRVWGTDFRAGFTVGYTLFDILGVYVSPRAFGGPIFIEQGGARLQGRDRYFFQVGLGVSLDLPVGLTVFFDASPGPEQSLSGGLAFSF